MSILNLPHLKTRLREFGFRNNVIISSGRALEHHGTMARRMKACGGSRIARAVAPKAPVAADSEDSLSEPPFQQCYQASNSVRLTISIGSVQSFRSWGSSQQALARQSAAPELFELQHPAPFPNEPAFGQQMMPINDCKSVSDIRPHDLGSRTAISIGCPARAIINNYVIR